MADPLNAAAKRLKSTLGADALSVKAGHGELTVTVPAQNIVKVLRALKEDGEWLFQCLMDISGADYPEREKRFEVVYHLLSLSLNQRLRVKVETDEKTPVPTAIGVFRAAGWFEREVWDLYGVLFSGHPDLRRILTDYGFSGHPLRKDFPLTGFVELRYNNEQKRVVYEPVKLAQDFRTFDFLSPWEGAKYVPADKDKPGKK